MLDDAGNLLKWIGEYGNMDCQGRKSKFPKPEIALAAATMTCDIVDDKLYIVDASNRRILRVRFDYAETQDATVVIK